MLIFTSRWTNKQEPAAQICLKIKFLSCILCPRCENCRGNKARVVYKSITSSSTSKMLHLGLQDWINKNLWKKLLLKCYWPISLMCHLWVLLSFRAVHYLFHMYAVDTDEQSRASVVPKNNRIPKSDANWHQSLLFSSISSSRTHCTVKWVVKQNKLHLYRVDCLIFRVIVVSLK